jgi:hypothetical protein
MQKLACGRFDAIHMLYDASVLVSEKPHDRAPNFDGNQRCI